MKPLVFSICLPFLVCSAEMLSTGEREVDRTDNCGLNAALFLVQWFGIPVRPEQLQGELNLGSRWENPASLKQIKDVLAQRGLRVDAYKDVKLSEAIQQLDGKHVCLLHVQKEKGTIGHYFILIARREDNVLLVNPGHTRAWISIEKFSSEFSSGFTGFCLFVQEGKVNR